VSERLIGLMQIILHLIQAYPHILAIIRAANISP
jgi:hypothetical protein